VGVVVAIAALLLPSRYVGYAGLLFFLNAVWGRLAGAAFARRERLVMERMQAASAASSGS
jgi:hypothetical protein